MKKIFAPFQMPSIKKCVAVGCNTDQNSKIILFSIPRPIPESWRKFLSVSDFNSKTKICEKHFKKCDVICDKNCLHKKIFPWPEKYHLQTELSKSLAIRFLWTLKSTVW